MQKKEISNMLKSGMARHKEGKSEEKSRQKSKMKALKTCCK